ncbi:hypothetical protein [Roseibium sp. M-1]
MFFQRVREILGYCANPTSEKHCQFISPRGILKSTKTHVSDPSSGMRKLPREFRRRLKGRIGSIYLTVQMLPRFADRHLERIRSPFVLVTGDSTLSVNDRDIPVNVLHTLLENPFLSTWYAQNLDFKHAKLKHLPLGIDFHTLSSSEPGGASNKWGAQLTPVAQEDRLLRIALASAPLSERRKQAFSNWHFAAERGDRKECLEEFPRELTHFQPDFMEREVSWKLNTNFAFTLSPLGKGLDCHRTWEALLLGTIPVVKTSSLDPLYEDLPVVILQKWSDFTPSRLETELEKAISGRYNFDKLRLSYWADLINGKNPRPSVLMSIDEFMSSLEK